MGEGGDVTIRYTDNGISLNGAAAKVTFPILWFLKKDMYVYSTRVRQIASRSRLCRPLGGGGGGSLWVVGFGQGCFSLVVE